MSIQHVNRLQKNILSSEHITHGPYKTFKQPQNYSKNDKPLELTYEWLTARSLNGWIRTPRGSRDLLSKVCVVGIAFRVQDIMLQWHVISHH